MHTAKGCPDLDVCFLCSRGLLQLPAVPQGTWGQGPHSSQVCKSCRDNVLLGNSLICFPLGTFLNRRCCISANRGFLNEQLPWLHLYILLGSTCIHTCCIAISVSKASWLFGETFSCHLCFLCGYHWLRIYEFYEQYTAGAWRSPVQGGQETSHLGRTLLLYPATEGPSISCSCCSAGLNPYQELCQVYLLWTLSKKTIILFSLGNIYLPLGSNLPFVDMSLSNNYSEDLGLHRWQEAIGWPLYFHLKYLCF